MNYYFKSAPALLLNPTLKNELISLDRNKLTVADQSYYDMDPAKMSMLMEQNYPDEMHHFFDFYGENFSNLASNTTWYLPDHIENALLNDYQDFFKLIDEAPEIRIQAMHGIRLPVHVDIHRTVSIIHPLKNHTNTWTKFYDHKKDIDLWQSHYSAIKDISWPHCDLPSEFLHLPERIKTEMLGLQGTYTLLTDSIRASSQTIVNPTQITEVCQVEIAEFPCILNASKCHSVYCPDVPTVENPRIAIFFKWRQAKFTQVVDAYHQFLKTND